MDDLMVAPGGALRALDDEGRVGGYLVLYGSPEERELDGYYFSPACDFGPHDGDGAYCLFHHGIAVHPALQDLAERQFKSLRTERQELGLWAETVLDLADEYEREVHALIVAGRLGWSAGAAPHLIRSAEGGEFVQFPIAEGSITPSPQQPRSKVIALRSLLEEGLEVDAATVAAMVQAFRPQAGSSEEPAADAATAVEPTPPVPAELAPIRTHTQQEVNIMDQQTAMTPADQGRAAPLQDLQDPVVQGAQNFDEVAIRAIAAQVAQEMGISQRGGVVTPQQVTSMSQGQIMDALAPRLDEPALRGIVEQVTDRIWARMQALPALQTGGFQTGRVPGVEAGDEAAVAALRAWNQYLSKGPGGLTPELRATLQVDQDVGGGYLTAPEKWMALLIKAVDNYVHVRQRATVHPVEGADSLGVPTLDTNVSDPTWTSELSIGSEDTGVEFGKRALHPHPLAKYIKVSKTLLRRSRLGIDALIRDRLAYKFAVAMENGFLNGTGAGQPLGLFTASAQGISTGRDVTMSAVVADVVNGDDLIDSQYTLKQQYWTNSAWIMHRDLAKTIRKLKTTTDYIWVPRFGESPATILGFPYLLSEYAPNTFTANQYIAVLGDLSFYWIADAMNTMEVQVLVELYAATNQNAYIGRMESDGMPVLEEAFVRLKMAAA